MSSKNNQSKKKSNENSNSSNQKSTKTTKSTKATSKTTKATSKSNKNNKQKKKKSRVLQVASLVFLIALVAGYFIGLNYEENIDQSLGLLTIERPQKGEKIEIGKMTVHFIDVGQGDSTLIELPDNKTMLIDAGDRGSTVADKILTYIDDVNILREDNGIDEISTFDYGMITHSHEDHFGALVKIMEKYRFDTFFRPNEQVIYENFNDPALTKTGRETFWYVGSNSWGKKTQSNYRYMQAVNAMYAKSNRVYITRPNAEMTIKPSLPSTHENYYEINFYGHPSPNYSDTNDYSPIIILTYKERRIALSGDCAIDGEADFVNLAKTSNDSHYDIFNSEFYVDVINLGHHGSDTSSSEDYLKTLVPTISYRQSVFLVVSCGLNNNYGHPSEDVLTRLDNMEFSLNNVLRTDEISDIIIDLVLYENESKAYVVQGDLILPVYNYTYKISSFEIRFKTIGLVIIVILTLIIIPLSFLSTKNKNKIIKSAKSKIFKK